MRAAGRVARVGLALLLVALWWFHLIHARVSDYMDARAFALRVAVEILDRDENRNI